MAERYHQLYKFHVPQLSEMKFQLLLFTLKHSNLLLQFSNVSLFSFRAVDLSFNSCPYRYCILELILSLLIIIDIVLHLIHLVTGFIELFPLVLSRHLNFNMPVQNDVKLVPN